MGGAIGFIAFGFFSKRKNYRGKPKWHWVGTDCFYMLGKVQFDQDCNWTEEVMINNYG